MSLAQVLGQWEVPGLGAAVTMATLSQPTEHRHTEQVSGVLTYLP